MNWNTVFFDLDGTLTDSGPGIINAVLYACERLSLPIHPRDYYRSFIGPPLHESFARCYELSPEESERAVAVFREYYNEIGIWENAPYAGIPALLDGLRAAGKTLMVATSKPEETAIRVLERFDLLRRLDYVAGGGMGAHQSGKAQAVARCLARQASRPVMVGDRRNDVEGAHANAVPVIGVLYGYGSRAELEEAGADAIAPDVSALRALLLP